MSDWGMGEHNAVCPRCGIWDLDQLIYDDCNSRPHPSFDLGDGCIKCPRCSWVLYCCFEHLTEEDQKEILDHLGVSAP